MLTADALILEYIAYVGEARGFRVERYMVTMHKRKPGSVRNTLSALVKQGRLQRVGYGRYRVAE